MSHMPIPNEDKTKALVEPYKHPDQEFLARVEQTYISLLQIPIATSRIRTVYLQPVLAGLRDAVAYLKQQNSEQTQKEYEALARELPEAQSSSATMRAALVEIGAIKSDVHQAIGLLVEGGLKEIPVELTQAGHRLYELERRIDAALNAGGEGDGWLPIASAPKDGAVILGAHSEFVCTTRWASKFAIVYGDTSPGWFAEVLDRRWQPTHWRPLPSPPTNAHGTGD